METNQSPRSESLNLHEGLSPESALITGTVFKKDGNIAAIIDSGNKAMEAGDTIHAAVTLARAARDMARQLMDKYAGSPQQAINGKLAIDMQIMLAEPSESQMVVNEVERDTHNEQPQSEN